VAGRLWGRERQRFCKLPPTIQFGNGFNMVTLDVVAAERRCRLQGRFNFPK
jgi:hypothetical protein